MHHSIFIQDLTCFYHPGVAFELLVPRKGLPKYSKVAQSGVKRRKVAQRGAKWRKVA